MLKSGNRVRVLFLAGPLLLLPGISLADEAGARAYENKPVGLNVLQLLYSRIDRHDQIEVSLDYFRTWGGATRINGFAH